MENFEGKVDLKRLKAIAKVKAGGTSPTIVVIPSTVEVATAVSALTIGVSHFVTKFKSCGKGFC